MIEALDYNLEFVDHAELERLKAYDDLVTQFSELVDGSMRTNFELSFDGQELYGRDGRGMGEVTKDALDDAEKFVQVAPNLVFELRRRQIEREEYLDLVEMAKGNGPNTMVVISDFPEELMDAKEDVGGYNITRKQTMMRLFTRQPNGSLKMYSQSLDGSDRQALEAIYADFTMQPQDGELLGQRITDNLTAEQQATLLDRLTGVYDRALSAKYGGEWYAGRRPADFRNTFDFVRQQRDLVEACIELSLNNRLNDRTMYNMAATMQKRFKEGKQGVTSILPRFVRLDPSILRHEIEAAGTQARQTGQTFSACGATLRSGELDSSTRGELEDAGYGNKTDQETKYSFDKKMHCLVCQPKPKKGEPKQPCGPCGICRSCDKKLGGKG